MKINNYRVCFGGNDIDYKNNFEDCRKNIPIISSVFDILQENKVTEFWWFFEPYVEITWIAANDRPLKQILTFLKNQNINVDSISTPENGNIADWYCVSDREKEFGYKTYVDSAKLARLFYLYNDTIKSGKGWENQYMRRCHVLANQLAFNYKQEGIMLIKRGILALLFWFLGHNKAIWIYTKLLRQKY